MEYTQRLSLRQEFLENSYSRAWTLIASTGFQLQPTPTCLGLKGFVVVVVTKTFLSKKLKQLFKMPTFNTEPKLYRNHGVDQHLVKLILIASLYRLYTNAQYQNYIGTIEDHASQMILIAMVIQHTEQVGFTHLPIFGIVDLEQKHTMCLNSQYHFMVN